MSRVHKFSKKSGCEICDFPITDRHHLLPKGEFGGALDSIEETFAYLCPNCHRLFHTVDGICSSPKREYSAIDMVTRAANGSLIRHLMPEIIRLVIRSREMRIYVLEESEGYYPHGERVAKNRDLIELSRQTISECHALIDFLAKHGVRERTALDLMIGGAA